jgi:poly(A) polymerase
LEKVLSIAHPKRALTDLWELGVLKTVLPELHGCKGVAQPKDFHHEGDVWDHTLDCTEHFTEDHGKDVRLAALFHDCGKAETFSLKERIRFDHHAQVSADLAVSALKRLQMTKARTDKIHWLISHHMMMGSFTSLTEERKAHWYFHPWFQELLQLFALDISGTEPQDFSLYDSIIDDYDAFLNTHPRPEKPLLTGDEVMRILGLRPGEEVGRVLQALHAAQMRKEVTGKKEAREFLKKIRQ